MDGVARALGNYNITVNAYTGVKTRQHVNHVICLLLASMAQVPEAKGLVLAA